MSIIRTIMWKLAKRAAADPRVQRVAVDAAFKVDKKLDKAADKFVQVAAAQEPAREAGRIIGRIFGGPKDDEN